MLKRFLPFYIRSATGFSPSSWSSSSAAARVAARRMTRSPRRQRRAFDGDDSNPACVAHWARPSHNRRFRWSHVGHVDRSVTRRPVSLHRRPATVRAVRTGVTLTNAADYPRPSRPSSASRSPTRNPSVGRRPSSARSVPTPAQLDGSSRKANPRRVGCCSRSASSSTGLRCGSSRHHVRPYHRIRTVMTVALLQSYNTSSESTGRVLSRVGFLRPHRRRHRWPSKNTGGASSCSVCCSPARIIVMR